MLLRPNAVDKEFFSPVESYVRAHLEAALKEFKQTEEYQKIFKDEKEKSAINIGMSTISIS